MPTTTAVVLRPVLKLDGSDMSVDAHALLSAMTVRSELGTPAHARVEFSVRPQDTAPTVALGAVLEISVDGAGSQPWVIFSGLVTGLGVDLGTGFSQTVVIEAYDKLYELSRASKAVALVDTSPSDAVKSIATQVGLDCEIDDGFGGSAPRNSSYWYGTAYQYIVELVRESGCEWFVEGSTLHIRPRTASEAGSVTLVAGEDLRSFSARFSASDHAETVEVAGWDPKNKRRVVGTATSSGTHGKSSTGAVEYSSLTRSQVRGTTAFSIPRPVAYQGDADRLATGIVRQRETSMIRARGEAVPNPRIVPGADLEISGLAGNWDGTFHCSGVEHVWGNGSTFRTFFDIGSSQPTSLVDLVGPTGSPDVRRLSGGLTIGIVTHNDHSETEEPRVRVKFPYLSDTEESAWARLVLPGAGAGRGWLTVPEIDDEVLVGFEHGDINRPFVLGGLYNGVDQPTTPPIGPSALINGGKVEFRSFTSRSGHQLVFADGDDQFVHIRTAGGEASILADKEKIEVEGVDIPLTLKNGKGSIEIAKNGDITITGAAVTIKATKDVKVEGQNINAKAQLGVKAEAGTALELKGTASAKLESSAQTAVKGPMVAIN
jgi:uncharacterized protein involved in type VI secretion and phage assembly